MIFAALYGHLEVIKWLCHDGGARDDIRKQDPDGNFEHLQYLLSDKAQQETETTEDLYRFVEICTTAMAKYLAQVPPDQLQQAQRLLLQTTTTTTAATTTEAAK